MIRDLNYKKKMALNMTFQFVFSCFHLPKHFLVNHLFLRAKCRRVTRPNNIPNTKVKPTKVNNSTIKYILLGDATTDSYKSVRLSAGAYWK